MYVFHRSSLGKIMLGSWILRDYGLRLIRIRTLLRIGIDRGSYVVVGRTVGYSAVGIVGSGIERGIQFCVRPSRSLTPVDVIAVDVGRTTGRPGKQHVVLRGLSARSVQAEYGR